jgi:hypothetical protein
MGDRRSGPASRSSTDLSAVSLSRLASTQPAAPPPTTTTSHSWTIGQVSGAGEMFWLNRNTLSGSYLRLTSASRAYVCGG